MVSPNKSLPTLVGISVEFFDQMFPSSPPSCLDLPSRNVTRLSLQTYLTEVTPKGEPFKTTITE